MRERADNGAPVSDPASFQKTHLRAGSEIGVPVAIAGCGAVSAVGCGIEPLRVALQNNVSGLRPLEKFNSPRRIFIIRISWRRADDVGLKAW